MQDTTRLLAIEEIKQLKARYFRAVDTKDAALFRSILTDDVVLDYRGSASDPKSGINAVPSSTEARAQGIWSMIDRLRPTEPGLFHEMIGWGHYHETYEKVDGEWKIKTLRLSRLRVDIL